MRKSPPHRWTEGLLALALLITASNAVGAPLQGGVIEGVVLRGDTRGPIPGVTITLGTGPADQLSARALQISANNMGASVPITMPTATNPSPVIDEAQLLRTVFDAVGARGLSPGNADLATALNNYREQTAKIKAISESDGTFSIPNLPPGRYTVRAERDGYFSTSVGVTTVDVGGGTSRVSFSMIPGATIGGRLRDDDGDPLANATVQAFTVTYPDGFPKLTPTVTAKTNHRGEYRLFWMKDGDYLVAATRDGIATLGARTFFPGTSELAGAAPMALRVGEDREGVDFTLSDARIRKISGEVISTAPPLSTREILGLPPGAVPPDYVIPNGVNVMVVARDPNTPDSADNPSVSYVALEGNRGTFEFKAPPGAYDLIGMPISVGGSGRIALDIGNQDLSGVSLRISAGSQVKGVIKTNGATVDLLRARLRLLTNTSKVSSIASVLTTPDGSFTASVPLEGRYRVEALVFPPGVYVSDLVQNGTSVFDAGIAVAEETPPVEIHLRGDGGIVTGTVRDAAGNVVANATVSVVPVEGRRQNRMLFKVGRSNAQGAFSIPSIAPGEYKIFAWRGIPDGSFYNATFLSRYEDKGRAIRITPSGTTESNLDIAN
jgi:hypothetical protein